MKPHKHAELIKAWADGAEIEFYDHRTQKWWGQDSPDWTYAEYRIKPEPETNTEPEVKTQWMYIYNQASEGKSWITPITPDYYKGVVGVVYMGKIEVLK